MLTAWCKSSNSDTISPFSFVKWFGEVKSHLFPSYGTEGRHLYTQTKSLASPWQIKGFLSPETYMRVQETGKCAKLKMTVTWWFVSSVLDLGWPTLKNLILLSTSRVAPLRGTASLPDSSFTFPCTGMIIITRIILSLCKLHIFNIYNM